MVDCTGLENRRAFTGLGGSNPSLSAMYYFIMNLKGDNIIRDDKTKDF